MKTRTEWKYVLNDADLKLMENKISNILNKDEHCIDGKYIVHSLYFDDIKNTCANDNDAGASIRYKYRIRYYNSDPNSMIIEKKEKRYGFGSKKGCKISIEEYNNLVSGNILDVFWHTDSKVLKQICLEIYMHCYKPKVIVDYERTAYVEPITNIRITFDRNISGSTDVVNFLNGDYVKYPLQEKGKHLLEVKFDEILPNYYKKVLRCDDLYQTTFSKFYLSRALIERN